MTEQFEEIPEPLVPAEVDLRGYAFTPIFRARLFGSEFHAKATDAEWRAGMTLWLKAWDQVPSGTLPYDEVSLCRLAEFGRDRRAWESVREMAMHGWRLCTDGRYHHAVVADGVMEAWKKARKNKERAMLGASARWGSSSARSNALSIKNGMLENAKGREGRIRDSKHDAEASGDFERFWSIFPRKTAKRSAARAFAAAAKRAGEPVVILEGATRYAAERQGQEERFTKHPATWLNGDCWADGHAAATSPPVPAGEPHDPHKNDRIRVEMYKRRGYWLPIGTTPPDQKGCNVPGHILAEFGFPAENGTP